MVVNDQPSDEMVREVYARFGLAYYHSDCLHRELCFILALAPLPRRELVTRPRIEERLAYAFSLTLGELVQELEDIVPASHFAELQRVVVKQNFLAHHFWYDRIHLMFSTEGVRQLADELDEDSALFANLDDRISKWFEPRQRMFGITDDALQECLTKILSGQDKEPLPDKETVRKLQKKLKGQLRLVHVWEFSLPKGGKPLVFEDDAGELWQLCDVGLGPTPFGKVGVDWTENPLVKPHLPANILPRPKVSKPWDFEFRLRNGAVLFVKPGRKMNTFRWGVRTLRQGASNSLEVASRHER